MKALVVYESMFGNTESVARAIAAGLAEGSLEVEVREVTDPAPLPDGLGLLVAGGVLLLLFLGGLAGTAAQAGSVPASTSNTGPAPGRL